MMAASSHGRPPPQPRSLADSRRSVLDAPQSENAINDSLMQRGSCEIRDTHTIAPPSLAAAATRRMASLQVAVEEVLAGGSQRGTI